VEADLGLGVEVIEKQFFDLEVVGLALTQFFLVGISPIKDPTLCRWLVGVLTYLCCARLSLSNSAPDALVLDLV